METTYHAHLDVSQRTAQHAPHRLFIPTNISTPIVVDQGARLCQMQGQTMGTTWSVQCFIPRDLDKHLNEHTISTAIGACLDQIVSEMSHWESNSHITYFNQAKENTWHVLPNSFFTVLDYALFIAEQTQGAYDPSIGHLANVWGFGPQGKRSALPDHQTIQMALHNTDWRKIKLNKNTSSAYQAGNVHLDFSSIAKGYAVDQVARYLKLNNIPSYLVEVGGELRGFGIKPDAQPWWVSLETLPHQAHHLIPSLVALHDLSVATSGDYRRFFTHQDQSYSHTIDPRTGMPITNGVHSVTVFHPECMVADALATAMTVMGLEHGMQYANQLHVAALFTIASAHGVEEHLSRQLSAMLDNENSVD